MFTFSYLGIFRKVFQLPKLYQRGVENSFYQQVW